MMSSWSGKKLKGLNNVRKSVNIIRLRIFLLGTPQNPDILPD